MEAVLEKSQTLIEVYFNYEESCKRVYKKFSVYVNGKKSNITSLKKIIGDEFPKILTSKTYFWRSSFTASQRRSKEASINKEVESFFIQKGFKIK